jgi:hypothetical protein
LLEAVDNAAAAGSPLPLEGREGGAGRGGALRDVGRSVRRRRVAATALDQVGVVQPRGTDANEELAVRRFGIRMLTDLQCAVDDRGSFHEFR